VTFFLQAFFGSGYILGSCFVKKIKGFCTLAEPNAVAAMMAPATTTAAAQGCPPTSLYANFSGTGSGNTLPGVA
jgi:hypothetical protein